MQRLFGYKEAYLIGLVFVGALSLYVHWLFWTTYVLLTLAFLTRPLDPAKK